jgi:hypothetical protein
MNPLEEMGCRFIMWVLLYQLSPDGEVEDKLAQTWNRVGRIADAVKMLEQ